MNILEHRLDLAARYLHSQKSEYLAYFINLQKQLINEILNGKHYYCVTYYTPGELLSLFDIDYVCIERISGLSAANQLFKNLDEYNLKYNLPKTGCSYQLSFHSLLMEGILPKPKGFIALSYTCDDAASYCKYASENFKVPVYYIDIPRINQSKSHFQIADQLKDLYTKLRESEKQTRSIKSVVETSNKTLEIKKKIDSIRFNYPGIFPATESFKIFTLRNDFGKLSTYYIFSELLKNLEKKIKDYTPPKNRKILWLGVVPLYYNHILKEIELRYNCTIVFEELFKYTDIPLTTNDFFFDLARRICNCHFFTINQRLDTISALINNFNVDGVIHFTQRHCRFLGPSVTHLEKKLDKPFVELKGDVVNQQHFDTERCWNKLDDFFDTLK